MIKFRISDYPISTNLVPLDSLNWKKVWQDSLIYSKISPCFYYSLFTKEHRQISILEMNEELNSSMIWLLKYDKKGKLKLKEVIAMLYGDGGEAWNCQSIFINTNQWIYEYNESFYDLNTKKEEQNSFILKNSILPNFKIKTDTLFSSHEGL